MPAQTRTPTRMFWKLNSKQLKYLWNYYINYYCYYYYITSANKYDSPSSLSFCGRLRTYQSTIVTKGRKDFDTERRRDERKREMRKEE